MSTGKNDVRDDGLLRRVAEGRRDALAKLASLDTAFAGMIEPLVQANADLSAGGVPSHAFPAALGQSWARLRAELTAAIDDIAARSSRVAILAGTTAGRA